MSKRNLADTVTLRDVVPTLTNREEYVRRLLGTMHVERKARGELLVRLGRVGTGKSPNYRFDDSDGTPLVAYDGANFKPWPPEAEFRDPGNWSKMAWTYDEVAQLRGELGKLR